MIVITAASGKGGAGKTTMLLVLAQTFVDGGLSVAVIDLDPAGNFADWVEERQGRGDALPFDFIEHSGDEAEMETRVRAVSQAQDYDVLLIDTEGAARAMTNFALMASNLVLIPVSGPAEAKKSMAMVSAIEQLKTDTDLDIPYCIAFTRTGALIQSRNKKEAERDIREFGIPILPSELITRESFATMLKDGLSLRELEQGVEIVSGQLLDPDRAMNRTEVRTRERQIQSAKKALQTAEVFTEAVYTQATQN